MKKCRDCAHFRLGLMVTYCEAPEGKRLWVIMGQYESPCDAYRGHKDYCGPDAKWFKPKKED